MEFSYDSYLQLITACRDHGYCFCNFSGANPDRFVIFRHDVDFSAEKAYELALQENKAGISSTYYFLLRTDFYNIASHSNISRIQEIHDMGHTVGLHYDSQGQAADIISIQDSIAEDCILLQDIIKIPVESYSFHRPNPILLDANIHIDGYTNAYAHQYFKEIHYVSDSRRNWRSNPIDLVASGAFQKLQILTHPFWYAESESSFKDSLVQFCKHACIERYRALENNLRDLGDEVKETDITDIQEVVED